MNFSTPSELVRACSDSPESDTLIQPTPLRPNPIPIPLITITTTTPTSDANMASMDDVKSETSDLICLDSPPLPPSSSPDLISFSPRPNPTITTIDPLPSLVPLPPSASSPDLISFSPRPNPIVTIDPLLLAVPPINISDAGSISNSTSNSGSDYDSNAENVNPNPNAAEHIPGNSDIDDSNPDSYTSDSFLFESTEDDASGLFEDDRSNDNGNNNRGEEEDDYEGEDDDEEYDDDDDSEERGRSPTQRRIIPNLEPGSPEFLRDRDNFATQGGSGFTPASTGSSVTRSQRHRNRRVNLDRLARRSNFEWLASRRRERNERNDDLSPLACRTHVDYDVLERFEELEKEKQEEGAEASTNPLDRLEFNSASYPYSREPAQAHWPPIFCLDEANLKRFEKRTNPPAEKVETIKEEEEKTEEKEEKPDKGKGKVVAQTEDDPFM